MTAQLAPAVTRWPRRREEPAAVAAGPGASPAL